MEEQRPAGAVSRRLTRRRLLTGAGFSAGWLIIAVFASYHRFLSDSCHTVIAGHDATVSPTRDRYATLDLGAYLPDVRYPTHRAIGVDIVVDKTDLDTYQGLLQRYELIGSHPSTLLVHEASMGAEALQRGCVDLVLGGHLHTQVGPDRVTGANGHVGVSFTNGTTGGAAYAVAVGSKLCRDAEATLVTYRAGQPIGLQPVSIDTTGAITVHPYYRMPHSGE